MTEQEQAFPSRLLKLTPDDGLERAASPRIDPKKINQHIEGEPQGRGVMSDEDVEQLLKDPFATLVLRRGRFPEDLMEILEAFDEQNDADDAVPDQSTFLVSEGGQIPFAPGVDKGGTRLITVRSRAGSPEVMIQTLLPPGLPPSDKRVLNEVIAWDPENRTLHFYQRQAGAWFWCGQSDMALVKPTRGKGPFDSHVNGYVVMKELKTPWVHWHGPGLRINEDAFAADDPLVADPLFRGRDHALNFEVDVIRPLVDRWNNARFDEAIEGAQVADLHGLMRQVVESTSANLISTHAEWSQVSEGNGVDLDDLPPTFFFDMDCLVSALRLPVSVPPLRMDGARYKALVDKYDLRVRGEGVDQAGDVPFCFTVPERALEDVVVLRGLLDRGVLSPRLAACLLMVDFANPVGSRGRARLLRHVPASAAVDAQALDVAVSKAILAAAADDGDDTPEAEFAAHWELGPTAWEDAFADRIEAFLAKVVAKLDDADGCDEVFRLAESRRRDFRKRRLAEFGLSLPQAVAIAEDEPRLDMTEGADIVERAK